MEERLISSIDEGKLNHILEIGIDKINESKEKILELLILTKTTKKNYLKKLRNYRLCENTYDVAEGKYTRWIPLKSKNLTNGGILIKILQDNDKYIYVLRNKMNNFFQITSDENIIFQKLFDQEKTLLEIMSILEKQ